jgi:hypothetical protein
MVDASRGPRFSIGTFGLAIGLATVLTLAWTSSGQEPTQSQPATAEPEKPAADKDKPVAKDARTKKLVQMVDDVIRRARDIRKTEGDINEAAFGLLIGATTQVLDPAVDPAVRDALLNQLQAAIRELSPGSGGTVTPAPAQPPAMFAPSGGFPVAPPRSRPPVNIDPKTPVEKLLPAPAYGSSAAAVINDLAQVPEVMFESPVDARNGRASAHMAHTIAKINHVNKTKTDAFMVALLSKRSDLAGLPFKMGEDCRLKEERSRQFNQALLLLRQFMSQNINVTVADAEQAPQRGAEMFWDGYQQHCQQVDRSAREAKMAEHVTASRIAALTQVCGPQSVHMRKGLVKYLAASSHVDATRALAKLAIFTAEDDIRQAAVDALKVRRERDYTDILVQGLRYPLPAVAKRAGEALVKLERKDLVPELVAMLDENDPRAPHKKEIDKKEVTVMREVVKINHHRNCLMCHAPGQAVSAQPMAPSAAPVLRSSTIQRPSASGQTEFVVTQVVAEPETGPLPPPPSGTPGPGPGGPSEIIPQGAIPIPGEPMPSPSTGYQSSHPDILVRIDVTYLRQDFSLMLPVKDAQPWPEMQRFDFLVRDRWLTDKEAKTIRTALEKSGTSPYRQVAHESLRGLTGQDAEPSSDAWRRLLQLPVKDSE